MQRTPVNMLTRQGAKNLVPEDEAEQGAIANYNLLESDLLPRDSVTKDNASKDSLQKERQELKAEVRAMRKEREVLRDMAEMLANLRSEVTQLREQREPQDIPSRQPFGVDDSFLDNIPPELPPAPKITYREATEFVPFFDGYNIPLNKFVSACRQARDILPPTYERSLTRLLIAKLRGRAHSAVADEPCDTVTQLIDLLVSAFGSIKNVAQYRGELTAIHLKAREHILDYIDRVKELRSSILDGERRARGHLSDETVREINELTAQSFCDGLPTYYRLQLKSEHYQLPFAAFAAAKVIAKRAELERQWFETKYERPFDKTPISKYNVAPTTPTVKYNPETRNLPTYRESDYRTYRDPSRPLQDNRESRYRESPRDIKYIRQPPSNERTTQQQVREKPRHDSVPTPKQQPREPNQGQIRIEKWCRYCKNPGHEISECRKREYYNSIKGNQGNVQDPPRKTDAPRADPSLSRPINLIEKPVEEPSTSTKSLTAPR